MLIVRDLAAGGDRGAMLRGVSFAVEDASVTAILGPDGAGKTTLANAICGLNPVSAGQVVFDGVAITQAPLRERIRLGISYVPAARGLFPEMSVSENLELGAAGSPPQFIRRATDYILSLFPDLRSFLHAPAASLPSGLQRIVMFARGLMRAPRLLVLDQPSFGLRGEDIHRLFGAISRTNREYRTAVLIIEQNAFQALKLSDTAWCMENGRLLRGRSGLELLADRNLQAEFFPGAWQAPEGLVRP